jgi:thermitase
MASMPERIYPMQKITGWPLLLLRIRIILLLLALPIVFLLALQVGMAGVAAVSDHQDVHPAEALAEEATCETATPERSRGGLLLSIPQGLTGNWVVRTGHEQCQILNVINLDILDGGLLQILQNGLPASNTWVYAKVELQIGGLAVVTEIRLHNYEPGEVVARLKEGVSPSTIASRYNINPAATLLSSGNIHLFTTPQKDDDVKALVAQMSEDKEYILWAELNYRGEAPEANPYRTWAWGGPEPTSYINQLAFEQVNLPPALEHYQGDGIVIAILDTGVDLTHPALVGRLAPGIDLEDDDDDPQDEGPGMGWGHGTHVAGIIARMAPNSTLLPVRVLDEEGQGNVFKLAYAIDWVVQEWVVQQDADVVINLSLGIEEETETLAHVLAEAQAAGVIIVAAAGNDNSNEVQYPIGYEGVIGVTALSADNQKADFANYGPWVDLAAPGVGISSTVPGPQGSGYESGYGTWRGTSMATAFISGAAALARQKYPISSTGEIATLLISTASGIDDANPAYAGQLGRLLDTGAAVVSPSSPTPTPATPSQSPTPDSSPAETPTPGTTPGATQTPATPVESPTPGTTPSGTQTPVATPPPVATPTPTSDIPGDQANTLYLPLIRN